MDGGKSTSGLEMITMLLAVALAAAAAAAAAGSLRNLGSFAAADASARLANTEAGIGEEDR